MLVELLCFATVGVCFLTFATVYKQKKYDRRFDFQCFLTEQADFSKKTFGPGPRTEGVIDHIKKELKEIEEDPEDLEEWIDIILLSLDGASRCASKTEDSYKRVPPEKIINMLQAKFNKNKNRKWPDWRTFDKKGAIEHEK